MTWRSCLKGAAPTHCLQESLSGTQTPWRSQHPDFNTKTSSSGILAQKLLQHWADQRDMSLACCFTATVLGGDKCSFRVCLRGGGSQDLPHRETSRSQDPKPSRSLPQGDSRRSTGGRSQLHFLPFKYVLGTKTMYPSPR